jgi:cell filamentation protein
VSWDPYLDLQAGVLRNRLGITDPFREGNGRTQRAFLAQLASDAGYRVRWAGWTPR